MDETGSLRARAIWVLIAIFALGVVAGASIFFMGQRSVGSFGKKPTGVFPRGGPQPLHPLDRMSHELELRTEQKEAIRTVLDEHREDLEALLESSRVAIRNVLTEEQRERFDQMRPPGPGGGPPRHDRPPPPRPGERPPRRPPPGGGP